MLISTDKAVRPTNVMGATKRLSELVVQAMLQRAPATVFLWCVLAMCWVLRGRWFSVPAPNPAGGPITLTHPNIIRYFMTIPEADSLVLQASVLAQGGEVFLLDMGEPVYIKSLAEQMVRLSGLSIRDSENLEGDIEIVCTGLRPGEKLYEELLIDSDSYSTAHSLIYRAEERFLPPDQLWPKLNALVRAIEAQDVDSALGLLATLVPEWQRASGT